MLQCKKFQTTNFRRPHKFSDKNCPRIEKPETWKRKWKRRCELQIWFSTRNNMKRYRDRRDDRVIVCMRFSYADQLNWSFPELPKKNQRLLRNPNWLQILEMFKLKNEKLWKENLVQISKKLKDEPTNDQKFIIDFSLFTYKKWIDECRFETFETEKVSDFCGTTRDMISSFLSTDNAKKRDL